MGALPRFSARGAVLVALETGFIVSAVALAAVLRFGRAEASALFLTEDGLLKALLIAFVTQLCLYYADLYDLRTVVNRRELFVRTLQALGATSFVLAGLYFWLPGLVVGRGVFVFAAVGVITLVIGWRVAFLWLARLVRPRERLLLVGAGHAAVDLARELLARSSELGVEVEGFVDDQESSEELVEGDPAVVGRIDDIPAIVASRSIDRVVVSLADARGKLPMQRLLEMKLGGVTFDHMATVYEEYTGKIALENLRPSWLIFSHGFRKTRWLLAAKRGADLVLALVGLVCALPVMAVVSGVIKGTSPGPVIYRQRRVGQHNRSYLVYKFRSMRVDAEAESGAVWARPGGDPRVTPVGRLLRRTRLDELPQLWNILRGDMSFVGPRPERPEFVAELTQEIPFYGLRHVVKPGLTGWAQVRYSYGASVEDAMQKLQYDLYYIKNLSLSLDLYILLETVKTVLVRSGS